MQLQDVLNQNTFFLTSNLNDNTKLIFNIHQLNYNFLQ
jgi:hypothetical protein